MAEDFSAMFNELSRAVLAELAKAEDHYGVRLEIESCAYKNDRLVLTFRPWIPR